MGTQIRKELSVFDSTCIIVGIIIGAGIYETAPTVAAATGSGTAMLGIWLIGGLLALCGALCWAELATAYPIQGGDYVYLSRAYGMGAGYLFGWSQILIIRPGDITMMAFIFARYAGQIFSFPHSPLVYACGSIALLTGINILGVRQGKWTQNILTVIKIAGLLMLVVAAFFAPPSSPAQSPTDLTPEGFKLALILVLFTYGGWNEMAYVAAEVRNPRKNILRALLAGTCTVTVLYLLANGAFLKALGYAGMAGSRAVAVDAIAAAFPETAGRIIAALICISTLGAINGLTFTGARITYAMGQDHILFRALGKWHADLSTPVRALECQGLISLTIAVLAGSFIDTIVYTAPAVWLFFLGTGLSVFVLRRKEPDTERPYQITGFPIPALVFCLASVFMLYNCLTYAWQFKPKGLMVLGVLLVGGINTYLAIPKTRRRP